MEGCNMKNVLITGFEPFGDYAENLSEIAATKLKKIGDYNVYGLTFPVRVFPVSKKHITSYTVNGNKRFYVKPINNINYGDMITSYAKEIDACAIISLGILSEVRGIKMETQATNWVENDKYCLASEQKRVLDAMFNIKENLLVDFEKWRLGKLWNFSVLKEEFHKAKLDCDITLSSDAGTFCCNALMFRTLVSLRKNNCEIPYLFLDIPCSIDSMSLEKLEKVLEVILKHREN